MAADSFHQQVENGICKRHYFHDVKNHIWAVNLCGDAIEISRKHFYFFKNYKSNGKDTNHPLIVSKKTTAKFIGKHHWMIQNLNQVSFYKRNSAPSAVKIDCQERKGFREVSTRQRKMIL